VSSLQVRSPALVEPQGPPRRHGGAADDLLVLPDDLLWGGAQEEVQVQHATNDPAIQAVQRSENSTCSGEALEGTYTGRVPPPEPHMSKLLYICALPSWLLLTCMSAAGVQGSRPCRCC
jgi:hypothetical protein